MPQTKRKAESGFRPAAGDMAHWRRHRTVGYHGHTKLFDRGRPAAARLSRTMRASKPSRFAGELAPYTMKTDIRKRVSRSSQILGNPRSRRPFAAWMAYGRPDGPPTQDSVAPGARSRSEPLTLAIHG